MINENINPTTLDITSLEGNNNLFHIQFLNQVIELFYFKNSLKLGFVDVNQLKINLVAKTSYTGL